MQLFQVSVPLLLLVLTLLVAASVSVDAADTAGAKPDAAATKAAKGANSGPRKDSRVHDAPPSDVEHGVDEDDGDGSDDDGVVIDDDVDDGDYYGGGGRRRSRRHRRHDTRYDHESFLGREESRHFDELSPEEAKQKLAEMFSRLDANNDTQVSAAEMEAWLADVARQERRKQAESRFHGIKEAAGAKDANTSLTLDEWKKAIRLETIGDEPADNETVASFNRQIARDEARWAMADADGDQRMSLAEFTDFLFAEHAPRMKASVVQEALNVSDINRDGKIDLAEYMRELYPEYEKEKREGRKLPQWVAKEEEHFKTKLDLNKDGSMDAEELYKWIVPEDIDHAKRETKHLLEEADGNKDKFLSKDEVLKNWELFVGHRATHYGDFAPSSHDEL